MNLEDWLDDLCVRFIINLPKEDLSSVPRICFQVEEAQWFYEDFIRPLDPSLPSMSLRSFCLRIFQHCPLLSAFSADNHMRAFDSFLLYKTRVPVRGAILLNGAMDSVLLVKGWKKGANWSFPRGKINKDEDDLDCAVREVYEETGYDIREAGLVPADEEVKYIEVTMREQHMRLYVFRDVPMDTHFEPRTRKEISKIDWYRLSDLPAFRKKSQQIQDGAEAAARANKFYMVAPFLVPLKKWVGEQKKKDAQRASRNPHLAIAFADDGQTEEEHSGEKGNEHLPSSDQEAGIDTMEGATAALHRLLKIQPPTQGLQPEAAAAGLSPSSKRSGEALLALLQGKSDGKVEHLIRPTEKLQQPQSNFTPYNAPISITSTHHAPNLSHANELPPLPFVPQPQGGTYRFHSDLSQPVPQSVNRPNFRDHQISNGGFSAQNNRGYQQHYVQPQQLQHPQPLPPNVQIAAFTGDHVHGPILSHAEAHPIPQHTANIPIYPQLPQFSNLPMLSNSAKQSPPKLTSHSLALLYTLKGRQDQGTSSADTQNELPLNPLLQKHRKVPAQPQELSADEGHGQRAIVPDIYAGSVATNAHNAPLATQPSALGDRAFPNDRHRSSLLDIFKASSSRPVVADLAATITTSADIRQGNEASSLRKPSVDPSFSIAPRPLTSEDGARIDLNLPRHQLPSPLASVGITRRPAELEVDTIPLGDSGGLRQESILRTYPNKKPFAVEPAKPRGDPKPAAKSAKPFQPQILRRPQPPQLAPPAELAAPGPFSPSGPSLQLPLDRNERQPEGHKQALLSLFKNGATPGLSNTPHLSEAGRNQARPFEITPDVLLRPRADKVPSSGGGVPPLHSSRLGSQAPISAEEKGFLLGYLDSIARGKKGDKIQT